MKKIVIMTWNILDGGEERLDKIAAAIRKHKPDVIGIQEALNWNRDKIKKFGSQIKLRYIAVSKSGVDDKDKVYSTLIYSRYMLKNISRFNGLQHGAVGASITINGQVIRFYSIHLHYLTDSLRRKG